MASQGMGAELTELVTQMKSTISEHFTPTLAKLREDFTKEYNHVSDWTQDVQRAIDDAGAKLDPPLTNAVDHVHKNQQLLKENFGKLTQEIHTNYVAHLHELEGQTTTQLGEAANHANDVIAKLGQLTEGHVAAQSEINHGLEEWLGNVDHMIGTLHEHEGHIGDSFNHLADQVSHTVDDLGGKLGHAGELVTDHINSALHGHGSELDQLLSGQKDHFISHIQEAAGGGVNQAMSLVGEFMHAGEDMGHVFDGGMGDVLGAVEQVTNVIHEIEPVLKTAKALL